MSDDIINGSIRVVSSAEIGENPNFDRSALKGYKCESALRRIIRQNEVEVKTYLLSKYGISPIIKIKIENPDKTGPGYEDFDVIELIGLKIIDFSSKNCMKLKEIYDNKGLQSLIHAIHFMSPIQKV